MAGTQESYTLYDIPNKHMRCWSPNTWKARAMLNVKKVPFTTQWVEYPDIAKVVSSQGLPPLDDDPPYTLPLLQIAKKDAKTGQTSTEYIRESKDIVEYLEKRYPKPAVDLDGLINKSFENVKNKVGYAIGGLIITAVPDYLNPRSTEFFHRTREVSFGCTLAEKREKAIAEGAWDQLKAWAEEVAELLRENGGPFFKGKELCYLDIRLVGILKWAEETGRPEDFKRIMEYGGKEFETFYTEAEKVFCQQVD